MSPIIDKWKEKYKKIILGIKQKISWLRLNSRYDIDSILAGK